MEFNPPWEWRMRKKSIWLTKFKNEEKQITENKKWVRYSEWEEDGNYEQL